MDLNTYLSAKRGRAREIAKLINGHESDISNWRYGKQPVPIPRCFAIENVTSGAVTRRDLRPDDWHLIWPELLDTGEVPALLKAKHSAAVRARASVASAPAVASATSTL